MKAWDLGGFEGLKGFLGGSIGAGAGAGKEPQRRDSAKPFRSGPVPAGALALAAGLALSPLACPKRTLAEPEAASVPAPAESASLPFASISAASAAPVPAQEERTFIAIKPDGVQRGLIAEVLGRFERKGYKLVALKLLRPSKAFAEQHYSDLKGRPFFNGLTDFLSSGPVVAMVWEGPGVIEYGRKMIGATNPQASAPGTIRGDFAVITGRNIIHGSDGPETAKNEIELWFKKEELQNYSLDAHKWVYE